MSSWKGDKPDILAGDLYNLELSLGAAKELESIAAKFCCGRLFFNYFGREARVSHRLFATSVR